LVLDYAPPLEENRKHSTMEKSWAKASAGITFLLVLASACIYLLTRSTNVLSTNSLSDKQNCNIKGNISKKTGKKVYHLPGCTDYDKITIKESKGERWFCSELEAIHAGWSKSSKCP